MSKPVTFEAYAEALGGIKELESMGQLSASTVLMLVNRKGFSQDMSQRRALLRELQKRNLLKPGKWFIKVN
jgi:hypothetical protein